MTEDEKQQDMRDLTELQKKTEEMISNAKEIIRSLRTVAKKLDSVWRNCKVSHAVGTGVGIVGSLLSIGGGIATLMTAGAASPLLIAGLSLGGAGLATKLGTAAVNSFINSDEMKKAEEKLAETVDSIDEVNRTVQNILITKERVRLIYIYFLAKTLKLGGPVFLKILRELVFLSGGTPTKMVIQVAEKVMACAQAASQAGAKAATQAGAQGAGKAVLQSVDDVLRATGQTGAQAADDIVQAGAKAGSKVVGKVVGKVIIGVNVVFVVWDTIELGFTIRDLVENKGSEAAKVLRQKAEKLENAMKQ